MLAKQIGAGHDLWMVRRMQLACCAPDSDPNTTIEEIRMWWGLGIIGAIIWIAIAFWPARVAGRKGHSFFGYFCLSLLFFPLALILAYAVEDRTGVAYG
jgi:hypothetical protein